MSHSNTRREFIRSSLLVSGAVVAPLTLAQTPSQRVLNKLDELGINLPPTPAPVANYVAYQVAGNMAYIAGQIPFLNGELIYPGKVPIDVSIEQAQIAARQCAINMLSALKGACDGDLDRVKQCVRLQGFVASEDSFTGQSTIMNAASDLMVDVFADAGKHTRLAIGVNTLPLNACVEISGIFYIE